jgi:hypothetical protein
MPWLPEMLQQEIPLTLLSSGLDGVVRVAPRDSTPVAAHISKKEARQIQGPRGSLRCYQAVVDALSARSVEIEPDGLRFKPKKRLK